MNRPASRFCRASEPAGEMRAVVLIVDDEQDVLNALSRVFLEIDAEILLAGNAEQALEILRSREVAVLVSDNCMPGKSGVELLSLARDLAPDALKILMTAYADLDMVIASINRGDVFRFVVKPWDNKTFFEIVDEALSRYRLLRSLKEGDEATILSLAQMIELKDPYTHGHCARVAGYALAIADALVADERFKKYLQYGSWLHDCGKVGIAEKILNFNGPLNPMEYKEIKRHPILGAEVVRQARLPSTVVNVVLYHHERFDGQGYPHGLRAGDIPLEARIASVADVYDALTTDRPYRGGVSEGKARKILSGLRGSSLDPELVDIFLRLEYGSLTGVNQHE